MLITKDTPVEEIVNAVPGAVEYLTLEGIQCIVCGEPVWGTLVETARSKGFDEQAIERFVDGINALFTTAGCDHDQAG